MIGTLYRGQPGCYRGNRYFFYLQVLQQMEIYLIRHTEPVIAKGVCYGQSDLEVAGSFLSEAAIIRHHLPATVTAVYSSPLQRCKRLAEHLFADHTIQLQDDLKEINCGKWELQFWDNIPSDELDPWMNNLINMRIPGGESYADVFERVAQCFDKIIGLHSMGNHPEPEPGAGNSLSRAVIVAHGGVIRSILSYITRTPLVDSFRVFPLHYGCVIRIVQDHGSLRYEVLSNIPHEKETHKPSGL
jgi:alpha-ribazole phosphatase